MMKKLLTRLPLGVAALLALSAVPVQAGPPDQKPINAKMELTLNLFTCPNLPGSDIPGSFLSWTGTVVIDGQTYGWSDEPLDVADPPQQPNDKFGYFEENWTIFTLKDGDDPHGNPSLACDANEVVMAGDNTGWGPPGVSAKAEGEVTYVAEEGPFANVELGSRMFWKGKVLDYRPNDPCCDRGTEFKATLHIS